MQNSKSGKAEKKNLLFSDISLDNDFLDMTPEVYKIRAKVKNLDYIKLKKLLYSKENNRMKW